MVGIFAHSAIVRVGGVPRSPETTTPVPLVPLHCTAEVDRIPGAQVAFPTSVPGWLLPEISLAVVPLPSFKGSETRGSSTSAAGGCGGVCDEGGDPGMLTNSKSFAPSTAYVCMPIYILPS